MARCTLDDLVPSMKCNRVFLEPISSVTESGQQFSFSEYKVVFDMSVHDVIDDDNGIGDYLLTEDFQRNIKYKKIYCRDDSFDKMLELLATKYDAATGAGMHPSIQAFVVDALFNQEIIQSIKNNETNATNIFNNRLIGGESDLADLEWLQAYFLDTQFTSKLIQSLERVYNSDIDVSFLQQVPDESYGSTFINDDGQLAYDLKMPLESITYTNDTNVSECSLYVIPFFDLQQAMENLGESAFLEAMNEMIITPETIKFFYKNIDVCQVLVNKRPANGLVQDFRMIERVSEIMDIDRITDYDATIDKISSIAGYNKRKASNIISEIYSSYAYAGRKDVYPINTFFINTQKMQIEYSKFPFLYMNAYYPRTDSSLNSQTQPAIRFRERMQQLIDQYFSIDFMDIFRERVDSHAKSKKIASMEQLTGLSTVTTDNYERSNGYSFADTSFRDLEAGEYTYKIEIQYHDPMENIVEELVLNAKKFVSRLNAAMNYINNSNVSDNSAVTPSYNELRDELSPQAIAYIAAQNSDDLFQIEFNDFKTLFSLFIGETFDYVSNTLSVPEEVFQSRKKIKNLERIIEDLLHEVGKFYETKDVTNASLSSLKASSYIEFSKTWNNTIKPRVSDKMFIDVISKSTFLMSESQYANRSNKEIARHYSLAIATGGGYLEGSDMTLSHACFTPNGMDELQIYGEAPMNKKIAKLALDLAEIPTNNERHQKVVEDFLGGTKESYTEDEIKNSYGVFETMLTSLGVSVSNHTLSGFEFISRFTGNPVQNPASFGLEQGANVDSSLEVGGEPFQPLQVPEDEATIAEEDARNATISEGYYSEFLKKEDLISRFLTRSSGYDMLHRTDYTQGSNVRGKEITPIAQMRAIEERNYDRPFPTLFMSDRLNSLYNNAFDVRINLQQRMTSRFMLDNTFMVFYLEGFTSSMTPIWRHATNFSLVRAKMQQDGAVFCKIKRYRSSYSNIGQGAFSDRDVYMKYFYLQE